MMVKKSECSNNSYHNTVKFVSPSENLTLSLPFVTILIINKNWAHVEQMTTKLILVMFIDAECPYLLALCHFRVLSFYSNVLLYLHVTKLSSSYFHAISETKEPQWSWKNHSHQSAYAHSKARAFSMFHQSNLSQYHFILKKEKLNIEQKDFSVNLVELFFMVPIELKHIQGASRKVMLISRDTIIIVIIVEVYRPETTIRAWPTQ